MSHPTNRTLAIQWVTTFLPTGLLLVALGVFAFGYGKDIGRFLREPTTTAGIHPLTGMVSNLGILLWAAAASICLFTGSLGRNAGQRDATGFFLSSACLSAYLCFDDLFQIHEDLADRFFGIQERYVYALLAIAVLAYFVRYRRFILGTHYAMLIAAIALLGASVAIDDVFEPWMHSLGQGRILIEDGAKWLGIAAWVSYFARTSHGFVAARLPS